MEKIKEGIKQQDNDNILISYSAGDAEHSNWFIYEYESHRKVLVQVDSETGRVHFLGEL